jgi:hypothetical protein
MDADPVLPTVTEATCESRAKTVNLESAHLIWHWSMAMKKALFIAAWLLIAGCGDKKKQGDGSQGAVSPSAVGVDPLPKISYEEICDEIKKENITKLKEMAAEGIKFGEYKDKLSQATLFLCAAHEGNPEIINLFIKSGVNVNYQMSIGLSALHIAASGGKGTGYPVGEIIDLLLKAGANPKTRENQGLTPREYAIQQMRRWKNPSVLEEELKEGLVILEIAENSGSAAPPSTLPKPK